MAYEIDYYKFVQDISDDVIIFIPMLELYTGRIEEYVLSVPSYITRDSVSLYFYGGTFDTDIMYKNKVQDNIMMDYRNNKGEIKQVPINQSIIIDLLRGGQFIFFLKDSSCNIVSEKGG